MQHKETVTLDVVGKRPRSQSRILGGARSVVPRTDTGAPVVRSPTLVPSSQDPGESKRIPRSRCTRYDELAILSNNAIRPTTTPTLGLVVCNLPALTMPPRLPQFMHDSTIFTLPPILYASQTTLAWSWAETSRISPPLKKDSHNRSILSAAGLVRAFIRFPLDDTWLSCWGFIGHQRLLCRPDHDELNVLYAQAESLVS